MHAEELPTVLPRREEAVAHGEMMIPVDRIAQRSVAVPSNLEPAPGTTDAPDLIGLLRALRRRWRLAFLGGLSCASLAAAAAFYYLPSPKYTTSSLVHVAEKRPREIFETRESDVGYRTYQETQLILVKSRKVLEAAIAPPAIAALPIVRNSVDPIEWLSQQVQVEFPRGSEILSISITANGPPSDLSMLVNSVTEAYLSQIVEQDRLERVARFERLKGLFSDYQKDLSGKRAKFKELAGSVGTSDKTASAVRQQMMVEHLGLARQELMRLQSDVRRSQARLNVLKSQPTVATTSNQDFASVEVREATSPDPKMMLIQDRISELRGRQARLSRNARKGNADPAAQALEREIKQLARTLESHRNTAQRALSAEPERFESSPVQDTRSREVEEYLDILREQEKSLVQEIAGLESQMSSLNVKTMDVHWLDEEIEVASSTAKTVGAEVQSMTVEMQAPPRIRLIEKASIPTLSDPMKRYKLSGAAGAGALVAFLGCLSLLEFRSRKVDMPDEVSDRLGLRIIGDLPRLDHARLDDPSGRDRDRLVQSIDAVRTMLLSVERQHSFQVVMVTSATKGEGKTSLSCHLATSLARAGRRTLLIDCDLRKPSLHEIFEVPSEPGLCEVLSGEIGWEGVVRETEVRDLSLILAGRCNPEAIELLPRQPLPDLIIALREQYEFIIVDSSPVLLVTDTLIISQHIDAVLFSVLRDVSQLPQIRAAFDWLTSMGVRILGAVVSGVPAGSKHNYGSYPGPK
ncbi:exopolysaccharide transport family protein [Planctomyces sp. SH-PL62]|uniref:exopolysaccharide transport family protein n=1 Tax=Planctomyces sp. SH-PL62 TaxID=1636152 RepID=UPI000839A8E7|nr:polysaccharide biosynthesis tyrosine autokinase [Planctomyces sp. SH-PL62]